MKEFRWSPKKKWEARGGNNGLGKKDQVPESLDYDEELRCERKSLRKPERQEAVVREQEIISRSKITFSFTPRSVDCIYYYLFSAMEGVHNATLLLSSKAYILLSR